MVACQWNRSSPTGPALHEVGGSLCNSSSSFWILLLAINLSTQTNHHVSMEGGGLASKQFQNELWPFYKDRNFWIKTLFFAFVMHVYDLVEVQMHESRRPIKQFGFEVSIFTKGLVFSSFWKYVQEHWDLEIARIWFKKCLLNTKKWKRQHFDKK